MYLLRNITALLLVNIFLFACNKDHDLHGDAVEDTVAPMVTIVSPMMHDTILVGETLKLKASVVENDQLHQYGFWVRNKANGEEYANFSKHQHLGLVNIDTSFALTKLTSGTTLAVQVYALDHNGNDKSSTVEVFIK
ncbi:MAG: hypothetical protein RL060_1584 [Bacteroidota bacterium]|jgi:hypothetical protein